MDLIILRRAEGILLSYTVIIKGREKKKKKRTNISPSLNPKTCEAVCYHHSSPYEDSQAAPGGINLISAQMRNPSVFEGGGSHLSNLLLLSEL